MRDRKIIIEEESKNTFEGIDKNSDLAIIKQNQIIIELLLDIRENTSK